MQKASNQKKKLTQNTPTKKPTRPPVNIKDEAAVVAEFRRLKKKINKLYNELQLSRYSVKVFKKLFFDAPEFEEVRELVLSFADEFAIIKNEIDDVKRFKKIEKNEAKMHTKEIIDKFAAIGGDIEIARWIFSECTDGEKHELTKYTYWSENRKFVTKLKLSPEVAAIIKAFDKYEYNNDRKHEREEYRHKFPKDWQGSDDNWDDDFGDEKSAETLPDNSTQPIQLIIKEARLECEKITLKFHEKHLTEVKTNLENTLPPKQTKRYYQYHYEKMRVVDISNSEGGTKASTITESLEAARKNVMIFNVKFSPSKELYNAFWREINPWKEKILFYNGGLR